MAKVTITIDDQDDSINLRIESDPAFPGPAAEDQTMTTAQHLGFVGFEAIGETVKKWQKEQFQVPTPLLEDV